MAEVMALRRPLQCSSVPLELAAFSGGSVQVSVRPQTAAIPAAVPTMHRYCER